MSKRFFWLKLKEDFFKSLAMKKLRKTAGGDTFTIIYLKMMLASLNTDGLLYFEGMEEDLATELALVLDEDPDNVKLTISFLERVGLLVFENNGDIRLNEVPTLTGSETDKAAIMRNKREKDKLLLIENGNNVTAQLPGVTFCYTEREKEKEKEKELEKEKEKEEEQSREELYKSKDKLLTINYQQIIDLFNEKCPSLPKATTLTDKRKRAIKARLRKYNIDDFIKVFEAAEQSPFLRGEKSTGEHANWKATIDFLLREDKFVAALEGQYMDFGPANYQNKVAAQLDNEYEDIRRWAEAGDQYG